MVDTHATFTGSIPQYYDRCLGHAWFDAFALDLAQRLPAKPPGDVLEIACGTGLLTRRLRERIDPALRVVASDLSLAMLDYARGKLAGAQGIEWREADASKLPFRDGEFGAVVCGFGFMFVPDKNAAFSEARRVLTEDGILLFNVWDSIDVNPHIKANAEVVEGLFPGDKEMRFRIPYEMYDPALLQELLAQAHFGDVKIEKKAMQMDGISARTIATGQIRGTPRSLLIEKRGVPLDDVIDKVTAALTKIGGADPYRGVARAVVVEARRR
jgi:SAM-dependent methyltransferase